VLHGRGESDAHVAELAVAGQDRGALGGVAGGGGGGLGVGLEEGAVGVFVVVLAARVVVAEGEVDGRAWEGGGEHLGDEGDGLGGEGGVVGFGGFGIEGVEAAVELMGH
jgi:hypothetical protein